MPKRKPQLAERLRDFRNKRQEEKDLKNFLDKEQPHLILNLREVDPNNEGFLIDESDPEKGWAFVQQNSGSEVWDTETIIEFLREPKNKALWLACSSRNIDMQKWESAVAIGLIPAKVAQKFKKTTNPPKPFIRFGKPKKS